MTFEQITTKAAPSPETVEVFELPHGRLEAVESYMVGDQLRRYVDSGYTLGEYFSHSTPEKGPGPGWDRRFGVASYDPAELAALLRLETEQVDVSVISEAILEDRDKRTAEQIEILATPLLSEISEQRYWMMVDQLKQIS